MDCFRPLTWYGPLCLGSNLLPRPDLLHPHQYHWCLNRIVSKLWPKDECSNWMSDHTACQINFKVNFVSLLPGMRRLWRHPGVWLSSGENVRTYRISIARTMSQCPLLSRLECMRKRVFALSICAFVRSSAESAVLTCALKRQIRWRPQIWFAVHVYHAASFNCCIIWIQSHLRSVYWLVTNQYQSLTAWEVLPCKNSL